MSTINIKALTPQIGKFQAEHPVFKEVIKRIEEKEANQKIDNASYNLELKLTDDEIAERDFAKEHLNTFEIGEPDTNGKVKTGPCEIHMVGRNSKPFLDFMKKIDKIKKETDTQVDLMNLVSEEAHEFMASLIVGWLDNGVFEPYSEEAAVRLVTDPNNLWLIEQLQKYVMDESNFFLMS